MSDESTPRVFLYAPQDFRNLCVLARTLETFGQVECFVYDPYRLIRERYGKSRRREMRVVSAGAFDVIRWQRVDEPEGFLREHTGRVVATVAEGEFAVPITAHHFAHDDLLLFGSEAGGLPESALSCAHARVTIPARGVTQSLNLAVALGVVLFEAHRQLAERSAG